MPTQDQSTFIQALTETLERLSNSSSWDPSAEARALQAKLLQQSMANTQQMMQTQAEIMRQQHEMMRSVIQNMR